LIKILGTLAFITGTILRLEKSAMISCVMFYSHWHRLGIFATLSETDRMQWTLFYCNCWQKRHIIRCFVRFLRGLCTFFHTFLFLDKWSYTVT